MQTFLKIFGVIIVIFVGVGLFLDNEVHVTREIKIDASAEDIHRYVGDLNQWPEWTPWVVLDPSIKTTMGDKTTGVGASQSWTGESGGGNLTFTASSPQTGIVYDLIFDGDPAVYVSGMTYKTDGNGTIVTWYMKGEMGPIIIGNYFAQLMDSLVGDSFQLGLDKLKEQVEKS